LSTHTDNNKRRKNNRNEEIIGVEDLRKLAEEYKIDFTDDNEKLVIDLALKGQDFLNKGEDKKSEKICDILFDLALQWKDDFTKMKAYLLRSQISNFRKEESITYLILSLKLAKKLKINEIEIGIRVQLAFEKFRLREFKDVLKEIKEITKHSDINEENSRGSSRSYLIIYGNSLSSNCNEFYHTSS